MRRPASTSSELDIQRLAELAQLDSVAALGLVVDLEAWIATLRGGEEPGVSDSASTPRMHLRPDVVQPGLDAGRLFSGRLDSEGRLRVAANAPASTST